MTTLSFTESNGNYVAEITSITSTINVDIERNKNGFIFVQQKASEATRYKSSQPVPTSDKCADVDFNIIHEAESAALDYKIISTTPVTKAYYG